VAWIGASQSVGSESERMMNGIGQRGWCGKHWERRQSYDLFPDASTGKSPDPMESTCTEDNGVTKPIEGFFDDTERHLVFNY